MKILAIRLKNLASLAGPFEIDFTCEPLASAGLFAITGPTGAGKSTLLDALCLALFGAVPRLNNIGRETKLPEVDSEILTSDPRTLCAAAPAAALPKSTSSASTGAITAPAGKPTAPVTNPPASCRAAARACTTWTATSC